MNGRMKDSKRIGSRAGLAALQLCVAMSGAAAHAAIDATANGPSTATAMRAPAAVQPTKPQLIGKLKDIQARQQKDIESLESAMKKRVSETTTLSLKGAELRVLDQQMMKVTEQIGSYDARRAELVARRELLDQIIFLVDTKWTSQPLQVFFEHQFLDMAVTDLTHANGQGRLWKFLVYASIAIREVPEPREDLVGVLESYINYSNVLNPRTPADFQASRDYTDGARSQSATSADRSTLGEFAEKRLREMEAISRPPKSTADSKLHVKVARPDRGDLNAGPKVEAKAETKNTGDKADIELRLPPPRGE